MGRNQRRATIVTNAETVLAVPSWNVKKKITAVSASVFGPLFLIYLILRCQKNQCVLYQLPLVVPSHIGAYFSPLSFIIVLGFISVMFLFSFTSRPFKANRSKVSVAQVSVYPGLSTLVTASLILSGISYLRQDYIEMVFNHYLCLVVATTLLCVVFAMILMLLNFFRVLPKPKWDHTGLIAFFWGTHSELRVGHVELKSFLYINVGLIAWAMLDLLILLHFTNQRSITAPLGFLTFTQLLVIGHSLLCEHYLLKKPFKETEGLGFFWLMRVLLYLPFLHSLPVLYAAVTEITLPKPAMLADAVLFLFGFIIYLSSIHQKENFVTDPAAYKNLQSVSAYQYQGKHLLISGYWGVVQKPDYLGYLIMWLSWTIACGFSGISVLVLLVICVTVFGWLHQLNNYNYNKYRTVWQRYISVVSKRVIPMVI